MDGNARARAAAAAVTIVAIVTAALVVQRGGVDDATGTWRVEAFEVNGKLVAPAAPVVLEIDGATVSGDLPCNRWSGNRGGDDDFVNTTESTLVGCSSGLFEDEMVAALDGATAWTVEGDRLTLTGDDVRMILTRS